MALLERMGLLGDEPLDPFAGLSREDGMLALLAEEVGGPEALGTLGTEPLPNEAFDWSGIPDDVHERVDEVLSLVDGCADHFRAQQAASE